MFKVGDKVKLSKYGESQGFGLISSGVEYLISEVCGRTLYLVGLEVPYSYHNFELVKTEKEATKMKIEVKETTKAGEKKFPCIRKGKTTGNLYLFHQPTYGYGLDTEVSSSWSSTEPFTGTVTLTQE